MCEIYMESTITYKDRPNTYEFGVVGNRFKLHFETAKDLKEQIDLLIKLGVYKKDE